MLFIEQHSNRLPWTYWKIRDNYTTLCDRTLRSQFRSLLTDSDFTYFVSILDEEHERDSGLGRAFLQQRLHKEMEQRLTRLPENAAAIILECTEAPYVSNLPSLLDLTPIYAESHQRSFDLIRGVRSDLADTSAPVTVRTSLDVSHYVAGLTRLDFDDLVHLRSLPELKAYKKMQIRGVATESAVDDLADAFRLVNILIEDRIMTRFPELKLSSGEPQQRVIRKRFSSVTTGAGAALEIGNIALQYAADVGIPSLVPAGVCLSLMFLFAEKHLAPSEESSMRATIAKRERNLQLLKRHLTQEDKAQTITVRENLVHSDRFEKEIMITA